MSARNMAKRNPASASSNAHPWAELLNTPAREGYWHIHLELNLRLPRDVDSDIGDALMEALTDFSPAVGTSGRGWLSIRLNLPAANLPAAVRTASALVLDAATGAGVQADVVAAEAMTEAEFDVREGWRVETGEEVQRTRVLSTAEAAELLQVTPARVRQLVTSGSLAGHKHGERSWSFDRAEVERLAYSRA